jgi:hypothetical protein
MNFGEMKTEVYRRLRVDSTTPVWYSEDDVEDSLNEGLEEMSDATEWCEDYSIVSLLSNLQYYDLRTDVPDTILAPKRAFNITTNRWLTPTDIRDMDFQTYVRWEEVTGEPERLIMRGLWWMGFWPIKNSDTGKVKVYYTCLPEAMVADTDEPDFPSEFQIGIIMYAMADLLAQDRETKKALRYWNQYQEIEKRFAKYVKQRISLDRVEGYA